MDVPLELAMKGATLAGVALGATGMVLARLPPPARVRCFVVTGAGVGLMLANALVAASPFALLLDGVFAAWAAATLVGGLREAAPMPLAGPIGPIVAVETESPAKALVLVRREAR